ncbi:hypothetical protein T9A_00848 [Alcanivorax jadensis T9]|uniref:Uncharacterized protein n=1 Tax=Alcanivorax jadensis T9 TaxID=1177181 RepID=A0ABR4WG60_9GAMM|nr:hypothetical protein [Alcanivorax jadensis]KGD62557.1 hypothetical protein T9A_00848 [Alcanivorax jadensis T9]
MGYEDFDALLMLPADFPYADLQAVSLILDNENVFVPGYIPPDVGLYHVDGFIYHAWVENSKTVLLPDRNIVSRLAKIAKGESVANNGDVHSRKVAAILAFAQCLDIQIEPSIAFHELAPHQGNSEAIDELSWFRVADNGSPKEWLAFALREADRIKTIAPPQPIDSIDLAKPLKRWRRNYTAALKIASLELAQNINALDKVLALFRWMYSDFILAGPAAILACVYFAPNSPPKKGLFKSLRSPTRERAIEGIKNAAWDITHLSNFVQHISAEKENSGRRFIFATLDESLREIARILIGQTHDIPPQEELFLFLKQWWPADDAQRISATWFEYTNKTRNADWWDQYKDRPDYVGEIASQIEKDILAWRSK